MRPVRLPITRRWPRWGSAVAVLLAVGCSSASSSSAHPITSATHPETETPMASGHHSVGLERLAVGGTARIRISGSAQAAAVRVAPPHRARHPLAPRAASPVNGYYLTFAVDIVDVGTGSLTIEPADFRLLPGNFSVLSGDASESGSGSQLVTTTLAPAQNFKTELTFDARRPHGYLAYEPRGGVRALWRF